MLGSLRDSGYIFSRQVGWGKSGYFCSFIPNQNGDNVDDRLPYISVRTNPIPYLLGFSDPKSKLSTYPQALLRLR
jgi:hypothetical protein